MELQDLSPRDDTASVPAPPPGAAAPAMQFEVLSYFAILNIAIGLGSPLGIAAIPLSYFLKDSLHLSPVRLAGFLAIATLPVCFGFVFGFVRDRWRSARWGDRQYLLVCALAAVAMYLWLAASSIDYYKLLSLVLIVVTVYVMIFA